MTWSVLLFSWMEHRYSTELPSRYFSIFFPREKKCTWVKTSWPCGSARTNTQTSTGLEPVPLDPEFNLAEFGITVSANLLIWYCSPLPEKSAVGPVMPPLACPLLVWPLPILQRKVDFVEGLQLQNVPSSKSQFATVEGQKFIQNVWSSSKNWFFNGI